MDCPCADTDAPLATIDLVAACLRFASDGDCGAGGSVGGVRVPLAAMVMVKREVSRCASDVVGGGRAQSGRSGCQSAFFTNTLCAQEEGAPCKFEEWIRARR